MSKQVFKKEIEISGVLKEELKNQVSEVLDKSVALNKNSKRDFTVFEMWNRQRNIRSATDMLRKWNLN